ncbi:MAG: hypothetical protein IH984_08345 [Planctomycetes bacterium]|nr:hypothetical protein [Planctomycetota bacterium]
MPRSDPARLSKVSVSLPFGIGSAEWESDPTERRAAWSLYVELVTRIAVQPIEVDRGLDREALDSLYSLFQSTRDVLKEAGPSIGAARDSVGGIAITVLNRGLRPLLSKWHSVLTDYESKRPPRISSIEHERAWPDRDLFRKELEQLRQNLEQYATALAVIAGVEPT